MPFFTIFAPLHIHFFNLISYKNHSTLTLTMIDCWCNVKKRIRRNNRSFLKFSMRSYVRIFFNLSWVMLAELSIILIAGTSLMFQLLNKAFNGKMISHCRQFFFTFNFLNSSFYCFEACGKNGGRGDKLETYLASESSESRREGWVG